MANKDIQPKLPSNAQVENYEILVPVLDKLFIEIKELSKKKQNEVLNELKVKMINRILREIKTILVGQPTAKYLDLLDDEALPTNSDTVLILAQFQASMEAFHGKYYGFDGIDHRWFTRENPRERPASYHV